MRSAIALLTAILFAAPVAAQSGASERSAFRLSLWGTVIPVAIGAAIWATHHSPGDDQLAPSLLMAGGFTIGPALGYSAAGLGGRGMRGIGLRAGLTLLSVIPAFAICGWDCSDTDVGYDVASLTIATGAGLSTASAIYDISRLKHNMRRRAATTSDPAFSVTPVYARHALGLHVAVRF